jgi:hypothetical protein
MYGISFGNEKVQKWITSVLVSVVSSVFLTQPIQVALTAIFFVSVFRKATEFYQDKVKDKSELQNSEKDDFESSYDESFRFGPRTVGNTANFDYMRRQRLKERKLKEILKKLFLHSMFLWVLFVTAFSNRELNCFKYQNSLKKLFTDTHSSDLAQSVKKIQNINQFWLWMSDSLPYKLKYAENMFNSSFKLADQQSYLIQAPILRQLRVKNSNYIMFF